MPPKVRAYLLAESMLDQRDRVFYSLISTLTLDAPHSRSTLRLRQCLPPKWMNAYRCFPEPTDRGC